MEKISIPSSLLFRSDPCGIRMVKCPGEGKGGVREYVGRMIWMMGWGEEKVEGCVEG